MFKKIFIALAIFNLVLYANTQSENIQEESICDTEYDKCYMQCTETSENKKLECFRQCEITYDSCYQNK